MQASFSNEFRLVAACCRWPRSATRNDAIRAALPVDWQRVLNLVSRHRVGALVLDGVTQAGIELPADVRAVLARQVELASLRMLATARETLRLQDAFDEHSIPNLSIKGSSIAVLAFGDPAMKYSWDIDLLVPPDRLAEAFALMESLGYRWLPLPGIDDPRPVGRILEVLRDTMKELVFVHDESKFMVELHWRLFDNPDLLDADISSPTQEVRFGGRGIRTLANEELFAYLACHGALHGWARLKWIADVAAFLHRYDAAGVERLYAAVDAMGAGRLAGVALLLCETLFCSRFPESRMVAIRRDRQVQKLARLSLACITYDDGGARFSESIALRRALSLSRFEARPGLRFRIAEFRCRWVCYTDRINVPLPRPLTFFYVGLRVPLGIGRIAGRWLRSRAN